VANISFRRGDHVYVLGDWLGEQRGVGEYMVPVAPG